jgi:hypothetical protein
VIQQLWLHVQCDCVGESVSGDVSTGWSGSACNTEPPSTDQRCLGLAGLNSLLGLGLPGRINGCGAMTGGGTFDLGIAPG